ncbi:putative cell survival pathways protein [Ophidiomyces ophidiicola]|uniref:putative cell survival pathways protein n=1 Tax=Ophidiomyces ophidiicola TaxID=1387563 RepID=UPI0020C2FF81|nr:putative cell survival pathways protein [Ophidiomyces ophidiicola]KAI1945119.1 putative cell survival pathways protein [Ophidiomyces ophidiicola]KAI2054879.1 putative cell survival pathways protein [Ophidiomyces ophidiicola]
MNWLKSTLASVAGTQEPIYGPAAIQSVAEQTTPYTVLTKDDLKWKAMQSTCVETQTFYFLSDKGHIAMVQVIYSNVAGLHTTCQFNTKIYSTDEEKPHLWHTDPVENYLFDEDMLSFGGDNIAVTLNEEGTAYTIKSALNEKSLINLTVTRASPGFFAGKNGTSNFGTDPERPWGSMRHAFWPQCKVEGSIITPDGEIDFAGRGFFVHALQGMKPHHLATRWNFANFQSAKYSAMIMEYTTPPSYGSTVVNVGAVVKDGEIIYAGTSNTASHEKSTHDSDNDWPEPSHIKFTWAGTTRDGKEFSALLESSLGPRLDRIDVMAEVPGIIKSIVGSVAGTKPYIYQFSPQEKVHLNIKIGDEEIVEEGTLYLEATFIS